MAARGENARGCEEGEVGACEAAQEAEAERESESEGEVMSGRVAKGHVFLAFSVSGGWAQDGSRVFAQLASWSAPCGAFGAFAPRVPDHPVQ